MAKDVLEEAESDEPAEALQESAEQRADRLERELLHLKRKIAGRRYSTQPEPVDLDAQPRPSDVRPGRVWCPDRGRFVPHQAV